MQPHDRSDVGTIREALLWASSFLREAGARDPQFEAELLLRHYLGVDRTRFLSNLQERITAQQMEAVEALCRRRANHEPIQYMFGQQEFYGREFQVGPGVLIPRPETEILIEQVLHWADQLWQADEKRMVADIGTGSGAIALTLACERPHWQVSTVDLSPDAITIAKRNAERLGVSERVRFLQGDLTEPILSKGEQVDILVSNPPYIPSSDVDQLDSEVRDFEPRLALDGGQDGLECYRRLCASLPRLLNEKALVAFEIGIHQEEDVAQLLRQTGVIDGVKIIPDLAGIER
ncbi:peptide chain release factor N(5)-glutamine methyltransferase, partial [Microbacteriaceae bacterium K1510]|nr:peptide chain release factor N(5)-glutamine methyltransferase [Microbacteriaceae bacterium K1510]